MPETSEVIVVAEVRAKPGQADALRAVLLAAVAPSRQEAGNNTYRLHEDKQTPGHFIFYENWKSQDAIDEHMRTPHFKALVAQAEPLAEPSFWSQSRIRSLNPPAAVKASCRILSAELMSSALSIFLSSAASYLTGVLQSELSAESSVYKIPDSSLCLGCGSRGPG